MDLIGVDGTSSGWIASIGSSGDKRLSTIKFSEDLNKLLSDYPDSIVVIDMPIELNKKNYLRTCDVLAKKYLGNFLVLSIKLLLMPLLMKSTKMAINHDQENLFVLQIMISVIRQKTVQVNFRPMKSRT